MEAAGDPSISVPKLLKLANLNQINAVELELNNIRVGLESKVIQIRNSIIAYETQIQTRQDIIRQKLINQFNNGEIGFLRFNTVMEKLIDQQHRKAELIKNFNDAVIELNYIIEIQ